MIFLLEHWSIIVTLIALLIFIIFVVVRFFKLPNGQQMIKIKQWLLLAVTEAEKELGDKTGQLKLRYVYDMFVLRFKFMSFILTFEQFERLVDEALEQMKHLLDTNERVKEIVKGV